MFKLEIDHLPPEVIKVLGLLKPKLRLVFCVYLERLSANMKLSRAVSSDIAVMLLIKLLKPTAYPSYSSLVALASAFIRTSVAMAVALA